MLRCHPLLESLSSEPSNMKKKDRVAVVGAGLAGLIAARAMADVGHTVAVFEKGRGLGGRMASRRKNG